ncbi:YihA family ribosome biogenesis GTP-binding protein [Alkalicella caledoniensis]|uniref:Probable GTP-binding protein EngB n=1 Tax=Alkalicella caledoniensis TaxID=2731377 RepID=A0A7G9W4Q5_ALKCA|nr:ribosome biogenesis GTP-binding protein YihA/YsxC [Alkalicella caledoniensis]QNO13667.1 YihA family ribosome biogenesis GTP-binding protein [Alkalicella caledoniensis]
MKIKDSKILISAVKPDQYPELELPEIALVGRSNVGKSSFINRMINRKNLARTSGKPGKTQTLNFYLINEDMIFVDVPGYGFAKVSKSHRDVWLNMITTYLLNRPTLKGVVQLIDIRHLPSKEDKEMFKWLIENKLAVMIVMTKADKIPKGKIQKHAKDICKELDIPTGFPIVFSAETGIGREEAWEAIGELIES